MAEFKHLVARVYEDDRFLNTAILKRTRTNLQAHIDQRPYTGSWVPGVYDTSTGALLSPEISSFDGVSEGRATAPLLVYLRRQDQALKVEIEHECFTNVTGGGSDEMTLSASIQTRAAYENGNAPPSATEVDVTGNASASVTTAIDLDVSGLPEGWAVVRVGFRSNSGTAVMVADSGGSGSNVLTGYYAGYFVLDNGAQHGGAGGLAAGSQVPHWSPLIQDSGGKASANIGSQYGKQVLFLTDNGGGTGASRYFVWVHPPIDISTLIAATDAFWYVPLGATRLRSITLTVTDPGDLDDGGAATDSTQTASVSNLQPEVNEQIGVWLSTPKIHCMGVPPNIGALDFTGTGTTNRMAAAATLAGTYQALAWAPVGDDDVFQRRAPDGTTTNYLKTRVVVCALVAMTLPTDNPGASLEWELQWRLRFTDRDGSSNSVTGAELPAKHFPVVFSPTRPRENNSIAGFDAFGRLAAFAESNGDPPGVERHVWSGVFPESLVTSEYARLYVWEAKDTSTATERTLHLDVRCEYSDARRHGDDGTIFAEHRPRVHLLNWTVISGVWGEREPSPLEVGVAT